MAPLNSNMRIAIISDLTTWGWAGCEELWAALAQSSLQKGHQVRLFLNRANVSGEKIQPLTKIGLEMSPREAGVRVVEKVRRKVSWKLANVIAPLFPPFAAVAKWAPDIVFISAADAIPNSLFLDQLERSDVLKLPYVIVCHNSYLFDVPPSMSVLDATARYYGGARRVFFVATRTRQETEHLLGVELPQAQIIRNPVNMIDRGPMPMPSGSTVGIAAVGRIATNSKGQDILLAALGSPEFRARDWKLSFYGSGPHVQYLQRLARHYQIQEKVVFRGQVNDVRSIWAENHLLAISSRVESAPLTLVEAMLCGRPAVVNNVGGILEWASEPETAFVSNGLHVDSFRAALARAWSARSEWSAMGARAREKAVKQLDPDPGATLLNILAEVNAERGAVVEELVPVTL